MAKSVTSYVSTSFDLSVSQIVETIVATLGIKKKDILAAMDIDPTIWSKILQNERGIPKKNHDRVLQVLYNDYEVDRKYIYNYPHYPQMFARQVVEESSNPYQLNHYGSYKGLQITIQQAEKLLNQQAHRIEELEMALASCHQDKENALLLVELLKKTAQNPATTDEK